MQCPDCGTLNARADRNCRMCGRELPTPQPAQAPAVQDTSATEAPPAPDSSGAEASHAAMHPGAAPRRPRSSPPRCPSCFALNVYDATFCRSCGTRLPEESFELPGAEPVAEERTGPAWESASGFFDLRALFGTMRAALIEPNVTFSNMRREGGLVRPFTYVMMMHLIFLPAWIGMFWFAGSELRQLAREWGKTPAAIAPISPTAPSDEQTRAFAEAMMAAQRGEISPEELERRLTAAQSSPTASDPSSTMSPAPVAGLARLVEFGLGPVGLLVIVPLVIFTGAFMSLLVGTLVIHAGLKLVGAGISLETTFRALCYSSGSAAPLQLLPGIGQSIGTLWALVIAILAQARAHETSAWRVMGGYLLLFGLLIAGLCSLARF